MNRYEKYKDSGFDWIGEIPEYWEVKKLKYVVKINSGEGIKSESIQPIGTFPVYGGNGIAGYTEINNSDNDDIIIGRVGAKCGNVRLVKGKKWISDNALVALIKSNDDLCFLTYQLVIMDMNKMANQNAQPLITGTMVKERKTIFPPFKEQTAIANYLDQKTTEIDELISQKKQLLELYEEEKTAIINQAVTKGIIVSNYDVNDEQENYDLKNQSPSKNHTKNHSSRQFKDSGIDWLGEIPEHWEVNKLKYIANANPSNIDKKNKDGEDEILLCNYVDVYKNDFINSELDFMKATASESQIEKFILEKGDVIATKDSETPDDIGNPALVVENFEDVVCGYHLTHIKPIEINGDFLFRFIQTQFIKSYFEVSANGVTRYGLGVDKFNSALIFCPPVEEQTNIVDYINAETERINTKVEKTKKLIELLGEYKQSLISEVVTGKVKVS